ncbi:flagellar hook-basal body complex protein [Arcobacter arenosus]|uniref:Flagellar hook protein FlgE n=1 Tax=Arcobacter arenosus TaxID=2576037 RepID=A0A5R8XY31_9BACT|nr:flagellar hook-basal body complex protein [Arcobacter arenosus]TLP35871.1 flagellar hook-basal body complex protein [Arcobacter arenosus]
MIGALWTGISGLASQQVALDNESNNIANVNTVGYKASRVSFADLMYQDSIGKGSTVTSAEKQYTQGSLNLTGSSYDMALNGDGFFVVKDVSTTGTSETYYTRAGNFRMGDNGTLQDASGNEVQGWAMSTIDTENDVVSTNSNLTSFTSDFTSIAGNQIIQFSNKIQTFTAKTTDYTSTATSDSEELSGSGVKTMSTKISDVEALISEYEAALEEYALDPDVTSSPAIAQQTVIDFPEGTDSSLNSEGDQIYVYINGDKITQDYISVTTTETLTSTDLDGDGTVDSDDQNIAASRIATYKALADEISNVTGLNAYTVSETTTSTDTIYAQSTDSSDVLEGIIKIDSIIPGEAFTVGDVSEVNGSIETAGTSTTITESVDGSGEGKVESIMEALKDAVTGSQQDIYQDTDVLSDDDGTAITWATGDTLSYTLNVNGVDVTVTSANTLTTYAEAMEDLITKINASDMQTEIQAININGNLVIESKESGEEFSGVLSFTDSSTSTTYEKEKNLDLSGSTGAGAEFMQIISTIDQTTSQSSLQLSLESLGLTDSAFGEFSVDDNGVITMTQDGVDYAIGQVAIAQFNNNIGLESVGDNLLASTNSSGEAIYTINNENSTTVEGETLELSTADLSESLVNLMVFQRAFEANSKSITTADDILTTLIQMKR